MPIMSSRSGLAPSSALVLKRVAHNDHVVPLGASAEQRDGSADQLLDPPHILHRLRRQVAEAAGAAGAAGPARDLLVDRRQAALGLQAGRQIVESRVARL